MPSPGIPVFVAAMPRVDPGMADRNPQLEGPAFPRWQTCLEIGAVFRGLVRISRVKEITKVLGLVDWLDR
jgi:hypothetical protein